MRIKRRDYKIGTEENSGSLLFQMESYMYWM